MSEVNNVLNTDNQSFTNYNTEKIFIRDNETRRGENYTNPVASETVLAAGTIMGRVTASGKLLPLASGAVDGSNIPVGVLSTEYTVPASANDLLTICISGHVDADGLVFDGADTLDTMIDGRTLRDRLNADTLGIKVIEGTQLSNFDNV